MVCQDQPCNRSGQWWQVTERQLWRFLFLIVQFISKQPSAGMVQPCLLEVSRINILVRAFLQPSQPALIVIVSDKSLK